MLHRFNLTGHTLPVNVIGFGTPLARFGVLNVKLSSPISPVLYLPSGQLLVLPSFPVEELLRQKTNWLSQPPQLKKPMSQQSPLASLLRLF